MPLTNMILNSNIQSYRGLNMRSARLWFVACLAIQPIAARAQDKPTFVFTAIPDQDPTRLTERFSRVATYLQDRLGVPVKYVPVKSYPAAVTAFENDEVQLAWFGGFTGVQARAKVPGSQAIAQGVEDKAFKTYFIANTAAALKPGPALDPGVAGKTFTFGARVDVRPGHAGVFHHPDLREDAGRDILESRILGRSHPYDSARAIRRLPSRRGRLFRLGT
jgi:phosphonate transport system substrate-binding protein